MARKLTLTTDGLIERYDQTDAAFPWSTSDWNQPSGVTLSLSSGRLSIHTNAGIGDRIVTSKTAARSEECVQAYIRVLTTGGATGGAVGVEDPTPGSFDANGLHSVPHGFSGTESLFDYDAGSGNTIDSAGSVNLVRTAYHWHILWSDGVNAASRNHTDSRVLSGACGTGVKTGAAGIFVSSGSANDFLVERFYRIKGRYCTVTGLTSGWKVRIRTADGTLITEKTAAGSTVQFDVIAFEPGVHDGRSMEIVDASDNILAVVEYDATGAASRGFYGGDVYTVEDVAAEPITLTNPGAETGDNTGWTTGGGTVPSASSLFAKAGSWSWRLHSPITGIGYRYQDVWDSAWEGAVDAGTAELFTRYWQRGVAGQNDGGRVDVEFFDVSMVSLGTLNDLNRYLQGVAGAFIPRGNNGLIPTGTRTLRFKIWGNHNSGTDPDAYIDVIEADIAIGGPSTPTISVTPDSFFATIEGGAYTHAEGLRHKATQFQVATDSGFSSLIFDETDTYVLGEAPAVPTKAVPDLLASTLYWFRLRYQDEDDNWSGWASTSETTNAGTAPNTPSIESATPGYDQVTLVGSALSDPVDPDRVLVTANWQVDEAGGDFSTPVVESLDDPSNLLSIVLGGLAPGTDYIARYQQRVDDGSLSAYSASFPFTTTAAPASPPTTPTVSLQSKTSATLTAQGTAFSYPGTGESHAETLLEVSTSPAFTPATTVQFSFVPGQTSNLLATNLSPGTLYYFRIRYRATDDVWSAWSAADSTTTLTDALAGAFLIITAPRHGAVARGSVPIAFTPASASGVTFEAEYTANWTDWVPIGTIASSPGSWDVSGLADGTYGLRLRATDGSSPTRWEYRAVVVDNAQDPLVFNANYDDGQPAASFTPAWNTDGHTWTLDDTKIIDQGSGLAKNGWAGLAFDDAFAPRDAEILIEVGNWSQGGAFPWSRYPEQAFAGAGWGTKTANGDIVDGLVATFYALPIWPYGCFEGGRGDGFLVIEGYEGGVRQLAQTVPLGKIHFLNTISCSKIPRYGVRLKLTTLEELPAGRLMKIQVAVLGMEIDTEAVGEWHWEGTWDTTLVCGSCLYASREITTSLAYRTFTNITVRGLDYAGCSAPPAWEEPTGGAGEVLGGKPCTLILQVYEDDRENLDWEVGTDPDHPNPYLCLPENYDEQEIDIVAGAATIGTVEVLVNDPNQIVGDQLSGWMTEKLSVQSVTAVHGRRCRLIRYISVELGWIVIADGPAGPPRMDSTYAGYRWTIRDTRETERKVSAFNDASQVGLLPFGLYDGTQGWGAFPDSTYAFPALSTPVTGTVSYNTPGTRVTFFDLSPGTQVLTQAVKDVAAFTILNEEFTEPPGSNVGIVGSYENLVVRWRLEGEGEADWREVVAPIYIGNINALLPYLPVFFRTGTGDATAVVGDVIDRIVFSFREGEEQPPDAATVEFIVYHRGVGNISEEFPFYLSGLTTGQLLKNLYDGVYSPRDPITGAIVPTGIRYDETALLKMMDPVQLRITERITDIRDWAEKHVYGPTGWAPALDRDLKISPVSQVPPQSTDGLVDVSNLVTEPSPDWDAGQLIVNVLIFTYPRFYVAEDPADSDSIDGLLEREVQHIFRDENSIDRHGEQSVEYDGIAFAAVGNPNGEAIGSVASEYGYLLAQDRKLYVFDRYRYGAQAVQQVVRRSVTALLRPGDWVTVDLTWLPDYLLRRRHMQTMMQVMAIGDLDCAWRRLLMEEAFPPALES